MRSSGANEGAGYVLALEQMLSRDAASDRHCQWSTAIGKPIAANSGISAARRSRRSAAIALRIDELCHDDRHEVGPVRVTASA
jgi:hypothetical protein